MTDTVLDFVRTAKHETLMIVGVVVIACLGGLLIWLETSTKDIKFWGIEITVPESDAIKACRAIQAAFREKALGLESERQVSYHRMEKDDASIDVFTRLQLEARERDHDPNSHTSGNEDTVVWRINNLVNDLKWREEHVQSLVQAAADDTDQVNQECGSLLNAKSR